MYMYIIDTFKDSDNGNLDGIFFRMNKVLNINCYLFEMIKNEKLHNRFFFRIKCEVY